ncbi:TetR family transcriptional regulator [Curtobacterium sp. MCBD17_013]|uniref:TetR/AcrR family transcriptional regulator n=1 Tax=Curtobacterium sp. MCBD17_013 TaxID=2175668 RepID=UPI000DA80866|nr:TetR/AcrR family transcriptional regulator [Curtobacterium sp. MCBD17_013]PZF60691.1 TetR family transcriptional regulator [Curtobacterium sp. MCBD17_013]
MARWAPGTPDRLRAAALDLFVRQGLEDTTVAQIAAAVGVTERTFFRHFADKREVLFSGQEHFRSAFTEGVAQAPPGASAIDAVRTGVVAGCAWFDDERRAYSQQRQTVILANPGLQERELLKMTALAAALRDVLDARGVEEPAASLAAETGTSVFRLAFQQWIAEGETRSMPEIARTLFAELDALYGAPAARARPRG